MRLLLQPLAVLAAAAAAAAVPAALPSVPVFRFGEQPGYVAMREPALLLIPGSQPALLAIAEAGQNHLLRDGSWSSAGCDIVSKRSTDSGATWSSLSVVLKNASQPSPVFDNTTGKIVMNANGAPHCLLDSVGGSTGGCGFNIQLSSKDGGVSWSAPTPIDRFLGPGYDHAAAGHSGLQLFTGPHAGRLLFIGHRGAYVEDSVWFTDDGGATYKTAKQKMAKMDEAQLVQNSDGTIIANMRWRGSPQKGRGIATSTDSGATFSAVTYDPMLRTVVCQASIFRSPQNGQIYYSGPASFPSTRRVGGSIRRSPTGLPSSWEARALTVNNMTTAFGYSALSDHPSTGYGGMLWESVICDGGVDSSNCTCPGADGTHPLGCVQTPECQRAGCTGGISFSTWPLDFPAAAAKIDDEAASYYPKQRWVSSRAGALDL
eukprot:SAG22_NODE_1619_length_3970_cov_1.777577_2_plen_431_part_00